MAQKLQWYSPKCCRILRACLYHCEFASLCSCFLVTTVLMHDLWQEETIAALAAQRAARLLPPLSRAPGSSHAYLTDYGTGSQKVFPRPHSLALTLSANYRRMFLE